MPIELKVKRSVFLINVNKFIHDLLVGDLLNEINSKNAWLDIIDVPYYYSLHKITYKNCSLAERSLEQGVMISYYQVAPHQIIRENFVNVIT